MINNWKNVEDVKVKRNSEIRSDHYLLVFCELNEGEIAKIHSTSQIDNDSIIREELLQAITESKNDDITGEMLKFPNGDIGRKE